VFLTARWEHVLMLSFVVDPALLAPRVPAGVALDLFEGRCYLSLVGFRFLGTRVLGLGLPFHKDFDEVNLRFYVRRKVEGAWRRGVTFVSFLTGVPANALVAEGSAVTVRRGRTLGVAGAA
jgi:hypothetical protein